MRRFVLERRKDVSGVSGTGVVAEGVEFTDGRVSIRWYGDHPSTVDWDSLDDAMAIHGHGDLTRVVWVDQYHPPTRPGLHTISYPDGSHCVCYCRIGSDHHAPMKGVMDEVRERFGPDNYSVRSGDGGEPEIFGSDGQLVATIADNGDIIAAAPPVNVVIPVEAPRLGNPPGEYVPGDQVERLAGMTPDELTDADYLARLAADRRQAGVEVDNPMRREVRPRRGTYGSW